ncbi:MAG: PD40 domain-containing protein [Prevotella sp.]|nr:PD40 domain-containing protein [Prevotella sp.]
MVKKYFACMAAMLLLACNKAEVPANYTEAEAPATIYPDYQGVTVPVNLAPLRFQWAGEADEVVARLSVADEELVLGGPKICPTTAEWQQLVAKAVGGDSIRVDLYVKQQETWQHYKPFGIYVSPDSIDPWISYRLISPSYVTYEELTLNQRCLESYEERVIYDNILCSTEQNGQCINCHHSQLGNPQRTLFHARQNLGGTMINYDGQLLKVNLKTDSTLSAGVYPAWHPTQQSLIAFSTNLTMQSFHTRDIDKIEVLDSQSDLILYDIEKNEVTTVENDSTEFETFPCWTPDGRWLYYSSAHFEYGDTVHNHEGESIIRYKDIRYNIYRKAFDPTTRQFGPREVVFRADSMGLSATLPRISPDGRWLLAAVGEWGTFHIWHRDADLWLIDLQQQNEARPFSEVNSESVESYHTWSHDGRWIVFSSRRYDGNFTRPFFAHVDKDGHATKPFELPAEDPNYHRELMKSYNVPEFLRGPVEIAPQTFADALKKDAKAAGYKK